MSKNVLPCLLIALLAAPLASRGQSAPEITSEQRFEGHQTAALHGLTADDSVAADVALTNLAAVRNRCALVLENTDGVRLGPVRSLTLDAHESRSFTDVLAEVRQVFGPLEARAAVSCESAFSTYALVDDAARSAFDVVTPVEAETSLVLRDLAPKCPDYAACFDSTGLVFKPQPPPLQQVGRVVFPAPAGDATRFVLSVDVKVGGWYTKDPGGKHLIYWFVINENPDMPGMLYFRGPRTNQAFVVHGLKLKHAQKKRIVKKFSGTVGKTYHVVNDYDLAAGVYKVTISDALTGEVYLVIPMTPNLSTFTVKPNSRFIVDMGFPEGKVAHEVPSWGWEYSNLHIESYKPAPATTP